MSFPPYEKYKDTGVEWIERVPETWEVVPLKRVVERIESGTSVNATDEPALGGMPGVLKTSCVYTGQFNVSENKAVLEEEFGRLSCPLSTDVLIVSRMNTPDLGRVHTIKT